MTTVGQADGGRLWYWWAEDNSRVPTAQLPFDMAELWDDGHGFAVFDPHRAHERDATEGPSTTLVAHTPSGWQNIYPEQRQYLLNAGYRLPGGPNTQRVWEPPPLGYEAYDIEEPEFHVAVSAASSDSGEEDPELQGLEETSDSAAACNNDSEPPELEVITVANESSSTPEDRLSQPWDGSVSVAPTGRQGDSTMKGPPESASITPVTVPSRQDEAEPTVTSDNEGQPRCPTAQGPVDACQGDLPAQLSLQRGGRAVQGTRRKVSFANDTSYEVGKYRVGSETRYEDP